MTIDIRPVTAIIGAEISGVDLRAPLADDDVAAIRQAWLDHLVLFFRDQHIDDDQHLAFTLRFGTLDVSPLATASTPRITAAGSSPEKLGEAAARLVLESGTGHNDAFTDLMLPSHLFVGDTTGPAK